MKKIVSYASIYIGTYEVALKIYECKTGEHLKEIDSLRLPTELAHDIFGNKKVSFSTLDKLCEALNAMKDTIRLYKVSEFRVCAGYALKRAENVYFVIDQIRLRCGLNVEILSNSEQRFLTYQASTTVKNFDEMIADTALLVDVGGSSLQITLFRDGKLVTTQHIYIGGFRVREDLKRLQRKTDVTEQLYEMIAKELSTFSHMYLAEGEPKYLILLNEQILNILRQLHKKNDPDVVTKADSMRILKKIKSRLTYSVTMDAEDFLDDPDEMLKPFLLIVDTVVTELPFEKVYMPGISVNEGIALDYMYENKYLSAAHDFNSDVIDAAWALAERYGAYAPHIRAMEKLSAEIFDVTKKQHGMKKRARLLIRTAAILHDCGKYISLSYAPNCTYTIVMASEILGLTHKERQMVALVTKYLHQSAPEYQSMQEYFTEDEYISFLKLLAILKVANAMDRSNRQKFKNVKLSVVKGQLVITIESKDSITLETGLFEEKADFFESVYAIRPVIRERKI